MSIYQRSIGQRTGVCCKMQITKLQHQQQTFVDQNSAKSRSGRPSKFLCHESPYLDGLSAFTVRAMMSTHTGAGVPCSHIWVWCPGDKAVFIFLTSTGAHWAVTQHLYLDLGYKLSGLQPIKLRKVQPETDRWATLSMKSRLHRMLLWCENTPRL